MAIQQPKKSYLFINGEQVESQNRSSFIRQHPQFLSGGTEAQSCSIPDATRAADVAGHAFLSWKESPPCERRRLLLKAADELELRKSQFTELMVSETGATASWAEFNVMLGAEHLREAASIVSHIQGEIIPSNVTGNLALAVRQAAGVVLGMAPWNAPVILGVRAVATPLACGNTVILKGSELSPGTHALIIECLAAAGFPAGVVNYLSCSSEDAPSVVEHLIKHSAIRRINFTGSTHVGRIIGQTCAKYFKPVVLELGGKAPFIVLEDADLDIATDSAIFGAFANAGQICMSTERMIVVDSVADRFVEKMVSRTGQLSLSETGYVIDQNTVERCNSLIDDALTKGARIVTGGKSASTEMKPTLIDGVTRDMRIWEEESFGPVKSLIRVSNETEAIAVANESAYGLSSAVFSKDINRAWRIAQSLQSGICHINGPTVHDEPQMPFGGTKDSGTGTFGGSAGVNAFTDLRWVTIQTTGRKLPF
ncbi:aldehyde dehydrogenase [Klebsiella pneumoniae]|uniref:aldehyde dehydrogenase n=1 Tax=Klebsiella pneumoniae TaxID=573 RepID=UPI0023AEED48|nr:aldehyde dehydrogenase [Klebsiella pneumoniae]MDE8408199.1 aldehyde dehydrogenase [Klebsiella pneumoniae]HBV4967998.1 aldehyde dehydrogenase [Klebsiella pneumoniae]